MQHSLKRIAKTYSEIFQKREGEKLFSYEGFISFTTTNQKKYSLVKEGDDFLVSSWYSGDLIEDYLNLLK